MPQKRNPDAAELVRGKSGRIIGDLAGLLVVMKGLPLAYSKDMQEDKEGCFDSLQSLSLCVAATAGMVRDMTPKLEKMKAAAGSGYSTATDLADWLVHALNLPFRQAHHVTGRIVALAAESGKELEELTLVQLQQIEPSVTAEVFGVLGVEKSVRSRLSYGGTAPQNVLTQARGWKKRLAEEVK
jgi:argininosuccinate lyase